MKFDKLEANKFTLFFLLLLSIRFTFYGEEN